MGAGSWVFNKANKDVYACFRIKSTVPVNQMVTRVSFEFSQLGGSKLYKKQNQAMETETPMMLLFVSNGTDPQIIASDITQMLETAYDSIKMDGMMPEEFEYKEIPKFTLKLNAPRLPSQTKQAHKDYNHFKEQGEKGVLLGGGQGACSFLWFPWRICSSPTAGGGVFWKVHKIHGDPSQQCPT